MRLSPTGNFPSVFEVINITGRMAGAPYFCSKIIRRMLSIDPASIPTVQLHQYLVSAVAPRPIAFVSTVDAQGVPNLAPYSFFNVFSSNPPICVFSSNRREVNNTTKDTLHNILATRECVINVVSHAIVRQMALCSINYPPSVDEFEMAGLSPLPSSRVKPARVAESPVQFECKVQDVITLGEKGGAGHLIICEIVQLHIQESVLDERGRIDPHKIDLMGRMGAAYYTRASGEALEVIFQDMTRMGIGFPHLPPSARNSRVLTGNDLGQLASLTAVPEQESLEMLRQQPDLQVLLQGDRAVEDLHERARRALAQNDLPTAAGLVWLAEELSQA
jgi:flavin reductase (DIM6/NTAB) family NADH-FMN oxidoreductase RutF